MPKFHLVLLIHAHQPVGNFEDVLERAYQQSYLPFVALLEKHPRIRIGMHYSGTLLEWIERAHPEYLGRVAQLTGREQVELVGGGFYEPILISIPPEDRQEQIQRLAAFLEGRFGQQPRGAWLAERVWEPQLPSTLAAAGVEYTLVDDAHYLAAGFEGRELFGYYVCEDLGATVKVIPGLKALRYLIPYRGAQEITGFLRDAAREHPGGMAAMGDDLEKFGVWPESHAHVYKNGWLESFFTALESNAEWLEVTPPGEYLGAHPPLGRADLPTASYAEMMEWALPPAAQQRFHRAMQEMAGRPEVSEFLRGSTWRAFFTKYSEANLLHSKMLCVSRKVRRMSRVRRRLPRSRHRFEEATRQLLRAQCNDAYWHGIFGGLYAPHLRTELWRSLVHAEKLTDAAGWRRGKPMIAKGDFNNDGRAELYLTHRDWAALIAPADGGTIPALDFRTADAALVNSMMRRPEAYHARLRDGARATTQGIASIHEQTRVKEPGLEKLLRYDRWPRNAFRVLLFAPEKQFADFAALRLEEDAAAAGGEFAVRSASATEAGLEQQETERTIEKKFKFAKERGGFFVRCSVAIANRGKAPLRRQIGVELVLNFLAANEPDRFFEAGSERHPLSWSADAPASKLGIVDGWQGITAVLEAPAARRFWIAPIETVSESEAGFERVYQGSQILPVWTMELAPGETWRGECTLHVASRG